ncbi:MAG: hypothetical protein ACREFX_04360 [Opitutaceae bacterium]
MGTGTRPGPGRRFDSRGAGTSAGRVMIHGNALGVAGPADEDRRAREIALEGERALDGEALRAADRDLRGESGPALSTEEAESVGSLSRDPSDPAVDRGAPAPIFEGDDENDTVERLVSEGVEEADSDQRIAAHRARQPE